MQISRLFAGAFSLGAMMAVGVLACAQEFPTKPLRILVGEPGGSSDFPIRTIAQGISGTLGQPVIVDNRPSNLIGDIVARAAPDGTTLLGSGSILWLAPLIQKQTYDPVADFAPVILVMGTPQLVILHPSVPVNSVKELIALAKAAPGKLNYSSGPSGSPDHIATELFKSMAGVNIVRIPYKGSGPSLNALMAGEVQMAISNAGAAMPHVRGGRLKALAVTSLQPYALLPDLPTVAAAGLPGYESVALLGVLAPAGTPTAIVTRLNQEITRVISQSDVKEKFLNVGAEVVGGSPEAFAAKIKSELSKWGKVTKDAGIRVE